MENGVEFDDWKPSQTDYEEKTKMAQWVISHSGGLISSQHSANTILIVFVIVVLVSTFYFYSTTIPSVETGIPDRHVGL